MEDLSSGGDVLEWHHICPSVARSSMKESFSGVYANQGPGRKKHKGFGSLKQSKAALPWEPNTVDVNNVIYQCHMENIWPNGASLTASSHCSFLGDPLPCLFVQLKDSIVKDWEESLHKQFN